MTRLSFIAALAILTVIASFVGKCERTSIAATSDKKMGIALLLTELLRVVRCASIFVERSKRIAGGEPVNSFKYPWMVSIKSVYEEITRRGQPEHYSSRCTGSFIDVYGTILTAAHCVAPRTSEFITRKDNETGRKVLVKVKRYGLISVSVSWGYYKLHMESRQTEDIIDLLRIVYNGDAEVIHRNSSRTNIDLALIYVNWFETNRMNCHRGSKVGPITLTRTTSNFTPPGDGVIAGFGCYPITALDHHIIGIGNSGDRLIEVPITYRGRMRSWRREREPTMFSGHSKVGKEAPYNATSGVRFHGLCDADSGSPYMVKTYSGGPFQLRGVAIGSHRVEGEEWGRAGVKINFDDINYGPVRTWITEALTTRYQTLRIGYDTVPVTC